MRNVLQFNQAKKIQIYDANGNEIKGHKAVVNNFNEKQVFGVVTDSYKIVQHDEVIDSIETILNKLNLKYEKKIMELNNGARVKVDMVFPEIEINLGGGDVSKFRATFDNSYDSTTGLRLDIGAFRLVCTNGLIIGEKFSTYYHRHTKGIELSMLEKTVKNGVNVFQTKIKDMFEDMARYEISPSQARDFLNDAIEKKLIANKYLEGMARRLNNGGMVEIKGESQVNSKWMLYNLISEELTHNCDSSDSQKRYSQIMNAHLAKSFPEISSSLAA